MVAVEGKTDLVIRPQDIAQAVVWALEAPPHMEVNDILVRPTAQAS